jgi:hypothetical protein
VTHGGKSRNRFNEKSKDPTIMRGDNDYSSRFEAQVRSKMYINPRPQANERSISTNNMTSSIKCSNRYEVLTDSEGSDGDSIRDEDNSDSDSVDDWECQHRQFNEGDFKFNIKGLVPTVVSNIYNRVTMAWGKTNNMWNSWDACALGEKVRKFNVSVAAATRDNRRNLFLRFVLAGMLGLTGLTFIICGILNALGTAINSYTREVLYTLSAPACDCSDQNGHVVISRKKTKITKTKKNEEQRDHKLDEDKTHPHHRTPRTPATQGKTVRFQEGHEAITSAMIKLSEISGRPHVTAFVDGKVPISYLFDSGSNISFLGKRDADMIVQHTDAVITPHRDSLICHDGSKIQLIGKTSLTLTFRGREGPEIIEGVVCYVTEADVEPVLGTDIMRNNKIQLKYSDEGCYLVLDGKRTPIDLENLSDAPIRCHEATILPPLKTTILNVQLAHTSPGQKTGMDNAEVLLELTILNLGPAIGQFRQGLCTVAFYNHTDKPVELQETDILGTAHKLDKCDVEGQVKFKHLVSNVVNYKFLTYVYPTQCFCASKYKVEPVYLFFNRPLGSTHIRGAHHRLPSEKQPNLTYSTSLKQIGAGPQLEEITDEEIDKMRISFQTNENNEAPSIVICTSQECHLRLSEMTFLSRMLDHFPKIEVRIYEHGGKQHLCQAHRPLKLKDGHTINIRLLMGGTPTGTLGNDIGRIMLAGAATNLWVDEDTKQTHLCVHVTSDIIMVGFHHLINGIITEISRDLPVGAKGVRNMSMSMCGTLKNLEKDHAYQLLDVMNEQGIPGALRVVPVALGHGAPSPITRTSCSCLTCNNAGRTQSETDLSHMLGAHNKQCYISSIDIMQSDLIEWQKDEIQPEGGEPITEEDVEEVAMPKADHSNIESPGMDEKPPAEMFDYSQVPPQERDYVKTLLELFPNSFATHEGQRKIIRDSRVALKIRLHSRPSKPKMYSADEVSTSLINEAMLKNVRSGLSQVVHNPAYYSPIYLRLRSSADMTEMRNAKAEGRQPNCRYRLISNYRDLNAATIQMPSYLPNITEQIQRGAGRPYQGVLDLSKFFGSIPLHSSAFQWVAASSPSHFCCSPITVVEGLSGAPNFTGRLMYDTFIFTNAPESIMSLNWELYRAEQLAGSRRKICTIEELRKALAEPDDGALPQTRSRDHVPACKVTDEMRNPNTVQARNYLNRFKPQGPIIRIHDIDPNMIPTVQSLSDYVDDGHCFADSACEYRKVLLAVCLDLHNSNWMVNLRKWKPYTVYEGKGSTTFLGYKIENGCYAPIPDRLDSVRALRPPRNLKEFMSVMGTLGFLSNHCIGYSDLACPLYAAMQRGRRSRNITLTPQELEAFNELKHRATNPQPMYVPKATDALYMEADSSSQTCASITFVHTSSGERKIVSYTSRVFSQSVRANHSAIQKELLAILFGLFHIRYLLLKHEVYVLTDAKSLIALLLSGRTSSSCRLELFAARLSAYPVRFLVFLRDKDSRSDCLTRLAFTKTNAPEYVLPGGIKGLTKDQINSPLSEGRSYTLREIELECKKDPTGIMPTLQRVNDDERTAEDNQCPNNTLIEHEDELDAEESMKFASAVVAQTVKLAPVLRSIYGQDMDTITLPRGRAVTYHTPPGIQSFICEGDTVKLTSSNVKSLYNPLKEITLATVTQAQANDPNISRTIRLLLSCKTKPAHLRSYSIRNGTLLVKESKQGERVCLTEKLVTRVIAVVHASLHLNSKKCAKLVSRYFSATDVRGIARTICGSCKWCALRHVNTNRDQYQGRSLQTDRCFDVVGVDHIILGAAEIRTRGKTYTAIQTTLDWYSSFVACNLVTSTKTFTVTQILTQLRSVFMWYDTTIITDNATTFTSGAFKKYCDDHGLNHRLAIPYHSQSNSKTESLNKAIRSLLNIFMRSTNAEPEAAMAMVVNSLNATPRSQVRNTNISPHEIVFSRQATPFDQCLMKHIPEKEKCDRAIKDVRETLKKYSDREVKTHAAKVAAYPRKVRILPGCQVLLFDRGNTERRTKQDNLYLTELFVVETRNGVECHIVNVNDPEDKRRVAAKDLKLYNFHESDLFRHLTTSQRHNLGTWAGPAEDARWARQRPTDWSTLSSHSDTISLPGSDIHADDNAPSQLGTADLGPTDFGPNDEEQSAGDTIGLTNEPAEDTQAQRDTFNIVVTKNAESHTPRTPQVPQPGTALESPTKETSEKTGIVLTTPVTDTTSHNRKAPPGMTTRMKQLLHNRLGPKSPKDIFVTPSSTPTPTPTRRPFVGTGSSNSTPRTRLQQDETTPGPSHRVSFTTPPNNTHIGARLLDYKRQHFSQHTPASESSTSQISDSSRGTASSTTTGSRPSSIMDNLSHADTENSQQSNRSARSDRSGTQPTPITSRPQRNARVDYAALHTHGQKKPK